jgi:release factor glutamine methyltransferase
VETVLDFCRNKPGARILDLCTGSGCIALALQKHLPRAEVHALDISEAALSYARRNIDYHDLPVQLHQGDVLETPMYGAFDIIVSNPPYLTADEMEQLQPEIQHEPASALEAGTDGLLFYRNITRIWKDQLNPGGLLAYEIGEQQGEVVSRILEWHGFENIRIRQDYGHRDRVVTGIVPQSTH